MIASKELTTNEKYHVGADSFNFDERTLVINHIDTFCIFDRWGDVHAKGKQAYGMFYKGTRYINRLELQINQRRPVLLSSGIRLDNEVLSVDLTNPDLAECGIKENNIHIHRQQFIRNGAYYEQLLISNFNDTSCEVDLSILFDADFSDIFEIRGLSRNVRPDRPAVSNSGKTMRFRYTGLDRINRTTEIIFKEEEEFSIQRNMAIFSIRLGKKDTRIIEYVINFKSDEERPLNGDPIAGFPEVKSRLQQELGKSFALFAEVHTNNENFNNWINRSRTDLQSLLAQTRHGYYPYAGVPWYNTAFGRDGIITAMEMLLVAPQIAKDSLQFLAATQATKLDPANDAEPGKIIHEMRFGEMANTGEVPFKRYYGTIDATPLFLMLCGMYYRQTGDKEFIGSIWNNILAGIRWIDEYGDLDGDGFVEYKHKAENGLTNQGWKDSYDSIMYASGELCEEPIALCEVQGYVYAAKKHIAFLAKEMGDTELSDQLDQAADILKTKFGEKFWNEELGAYALALDKYKRPCLVLSSNAGHALFTGIADERHAKRMASRLTGEEMFNGWGIRTLAKNEVRYNPMSYHNGSVWPHDNAMIAFGLARYGCIDECIRVMQGLFDAAFFIDIQRMPELFCGFDRRTQEGPTAYPVACSPQAWAVGVVFMLLKAVLQLEIDGIRKQIVFTNPRLPKFLKHLSIKDLQIGDQTCSFELFRHKQDVSLHVIEKPADWEVIIKQ